MNKPGHYGMCEGTFRHLGVPITEPATGIRAPGRVSNIVKRLSIVKTKMLVLNNDLNQAVIYIVGQAPAQKNTDQISSGPPSSLLEEMENLLSDIELIGSELSDNIRSVQELV